MKKIKEFFNEITLLQRNVPGTVIALFIISIISMNLFANKAIDLNLSWLALDCGIVFSWLTFLLMDMINKYFGPRAAIRISILALVYNLFVCLIFYLASLIPGTWGESYVDGVQNIINGALDHTFGGTWYVLLGSAIAFASSAIVNSEINWAISRIAKKESFLSFAFRSYISTFIAQVADNLIFALIVSHHFFGWSLLQCFMCAVTGAVAELIFEVVFSPIGYKVVKKWKAENVGIEYINYVKAKGGRV